VRAAIGPQQFQPLCSPSGVAFQAGDLPPIFQMRISRSGGTVKRKLSQGARLLAQLTRRHGCRAMARRLDVDESTLRAAAAGLARPRLALRRKLLEAYDIPPGAWTTAARRGRAARAPAKPLARVLEPDSPREPPDVRGEARQNVEEARADFLRLKADSHASCREKVDAVCTWAMATKTWVNVTRTREISMGSILRSPHWREVYDFVREVLARFPDALAALDTALIRLSQESFGARSAGTD
jgi:transcriptional regulator with XRE-family HTH domain